MDNNFQIKRFLSWLAFNVIIAAFPLLTILFLRGLENKPLFDTASDFPEMMFFAIIAGLSTTTDLKTRRNAQINEVNFLILEYILIVGILALSICYGAVRHKITSVENFTLQPVLFWLILTGIVILFGGSVWTQIYMIKSDIVNADSSNATAENELTEEQNG